VTAQPDARSIQPPRTSRAGRIAAYLGTMFPPTVMIPYGTANFLSIHFGFSALAGMRPVHVTARVAAGAATFVLFMLLMRVYDEMKDAETDQRLAADGDPRYLNRPIVTGHVRLSDLVVLRWSITALLCALNLPFAGSVQGLGFAAMLLITWLSFRWFFWPRISKSLVLAFVTHNPISLALGGYVLGVWVGEHGGTALTGWTVPLLIAYWLPVAAWETSRKIRMPADETAYETYSKVFGRAAPLVPAAFVAVSAALLVAIGWRVGLGWIGCGVIAAAAGVTIGACLRFFFAPTTARARLQPFAELYGLAANLALAVGVAVTGGVRLF
jgi:4-hydroxybenzoate polyprenyltransferase